MTRKAVLGGRSAALSKPNQPFPMNASVRWLACAALAWVAFSSTYRAAAANPAATPAAASDTVSARQRVTDNYARVPLSFEPNRGQAGSDVQFMSRGSGYSLYLNPDGAVLTLKGRQRAAGEQDSAETLQMNLLGANPGAPATALDPQPGISNYFIGNDPAYWLTGIPTFGKVNYTGIYPGIDLVFYGNQRELEYDFVVKPGGNPVDIGWFFRGSQPRLGENGSLELVAAGRPLEFLAPVAYQIIDGGRRPVSARYSIAGQTVRFALGPYDQSKTLIIDPVLTYFSYLGGTGNDYIGNSFPQGYGSPSPEPTQAAGIDGQGNLYVAGSTTSTDFPVASPVGTMKSKNPGQTWAFVSKFSADGSKLLYSTYIGGSVGGNDAAYSLAVDATGNAYITGAAGTNDFPTTPGAFQTLCAPARDNNTGNAVATCTFNTGNGNYSQNAFVLKLNPTGSALVYSSFLGGQGGTWGTGIAVDGAGRAYLTGVAQANGCGGPAYLYGAQYGCFPTTANALMSDIGGGNPIDMAFMSVFNSAGSALVYSTLFGDPAGVISVKGAGCQTDCGAGTYGTAIALDPSGNVYIGGRTVAANMITTKGAFNILGSGPNPASPQIVVAPSGYGYVAKFAPVAAGGTSLLYSTYFGGGATYGGDVGGLAADSGGNAYIAGETHAPDFPASAGVYQTICDPGQVASFCNQTGYVAKLNPSGAALVWATFFGSDAAPVRFLGPVLLDGAGDVFVLGQGTGQLPLGGGTLSTLNGNDTVYVAKFDPTGSKVLFGATFGGPGNGPEKAGGLALDGAGNIYVGGAIGAGGSFATAGAFQQSYAGGASDAFVAKAAALQTSTTALTLSATTVSLGQEVTLSAKVAGPKGSTTVPTGTVTFLSGSTTLGTGTLDKTGTATYSTSSLVPSTYTLTADYGGDANYSASTSSAQTLVVNPVATTTVLAASETTATAGTSLTFTAAVSPASGSAVPSGSVKFNDGATTLGTGTLNASGKATFTTSILAVGSHSITAVYGGDPDNAASTSTALAITISAAPAADFSLTLSPSSGSVAAGSPATVTVSVTPLNGFNAATSLACSGLPGHATCSFNPASVTPNGTAAATSTLTINSNVASAAIAGGGAILSLLLIPVLGGRSQRRRLRAILVPVLLIAMLALGLSACSGGGSGSGSGGGGNSNNTPKGTYSLTVTATAGSLTHSATYSYTVN